MVSGGRGGGVEKGHYVPNIFLVIGSDLIIHIRSKLLERTEKSKKCQQIQKKAKYLSVTESLSAGVIDSHMFVSCF